MQVGALTQCRQNKKNHVIVTHPSYPSHPDTILEIFRMGRMGRMGKDLRNIIDISLF